MNYGLKMAGWGGGERQNTSASLDRPSHSRPANLIVVRVIAVIPWTHHTRVKKADFLWWRSLESSLEPHKPPQVLLQRQQPSPTEDAEICSSHPRSWLVHAGRKPEDSSALPQLHSRRWLVNAWWKIEDLAIKHQWISGVNSGLYP